MNRHVNRRIRLFLAVLVFAFAGLLLRATWLQSVRAESLSALGQHTAPRIRDASRRSRDDLRPRSASSSRSANVRRRSTPTRCRSWTRGGRPLAVERTLGVDADRLYPILADRTQGFVYVARQADPAQAAALQRLKLPGFGFYPEERRELPAAIGGRPGARLRRHGRQRSLGSRAAVRQGARGPCRQGDGRQGSERPASSTSRASGPRFRARRLPDARPQHPGERGGGAARDRSQVEREERQRDRARPAHRRHPRDGRAARLRRESFPLRAERPATQSHDYRHVRAGLDVQAR